MRMKFAFVMTLETFIYSRFLSSYVYLFSFLNISSEEDSFKKKKKKFRGG